MVFLLDQVNGNGDRFIIALNSVGARERAWARGVLQRWKAPFITCEGALIEAAYLCSVALVARLVEEGDFAVVFDLAEQIGAVRMLLEKDEDQELDLTDACIVRMRELFPDCRVFSVDGDFNVYPRSDYSDGRQFPLRREF